MESLINQFMHLYFWVYLVVFILCTIFRFTQKHKEPDEYNRYKPDFFAIIGLVLFIMSFKF